MNEENKNNEEEEEREGEGEGKGEEEEWVSEKRFMSYLSVNRLFRSLFTHFYWQQKEKTKLLVATVTVAVAQEIETLEVVGNVKQCDQSSDDTEQNVSNSALPSSANAGSMYDM